MSKSIKITPEFVKQFIYSIKLNKLPDHIKLISKSEDSSSNSNVYIYNKDNNNYIIKNYLNITSNNEHLTEYKIYNYLNILRYLNVCDTIIINYDCAVYQNTSIKQINFLMFNETASDDYTIKSLYNLLYDINNIIDINIVNVYLDKIIPALLFQLTYTLECLVRAKVKHNDLHLDNILVFIHKDNIIDNPDNFTDNKLKYDKYIVTPRSDFNYFGLSNTKEIYDEHRKEKNINQGTNEYYVPNYGFKIKIFDFDRSCLYNINNVRISIFPEKFQHIMQPNINFYFLNNITQNDLPNEYIDFIYVYLQIFRKINNILNKINYNKIYDNIFTYIFYEFNKNEANINNLLLDINEESNKLEKLIDFNYNSMTKFYKLCFLDVIKYSLAYKFIPSVYEILSVIFSDNNNYFNFTSEQNNINNTFNINNIKNKLWKQSTENEINKTTIKTKDTNTRQAARKRIKFELENPSTSGYLVDKMIEYMKPLYVEDTINPYKTNYNASNNINLEYNNDNNTVNLYSNNNANTNNMSFSNKIIFINL